MVLKQYDDVHPYYLARAREAVKGMDDARVLKTDAWNEIRRDIPGTGEIIGQLEGVSSYVCVELMEKRVQPLKEMFAGKPVEVVCGALQSVEFSEGEFDAIICLGTINYMSFPSAQKVLRSFRRWLKPEGRLYVAVWHHSGRNAERDSQNPDERFYHNTVDFKRALFESGFVVQKAEDIVPSNDISGLTGFMCEPCEIPDFKKEGA